jgi:protein-S-isoprenylcysteine O-methyltransferase Ste14
MSFFQPTGSNATEANALPAPLFELKGRWAKMNFVPAITGAVVALGISRIGSDAIVQDLHAGAIGVAAFLASIVTYFVLQHFLHRDENKPYSTTGVFGLSRNPAYLSFFLPLAAMAYFDWQTSAACMVIYVLAMNVLVVHHQERDMQSTYGADFTTYRAAVPRWFA